MGCGIHPHVEIFNGRYWECQSEFEWKTFDDEDEPYAYLKAPKRFYMERNYRWFYVLAGVRGIHDEIDPIAAPRGLPEDISEAIAQYYCHGWSTDWHNASWVTYKELLDYPWYKGVNVFNYKTPTEMRFHRRFGVFPSEETEDKERHRSRRMREFMESKLEPYFYMTSIADIVGAGPQMFMNELAKIPAKPRHIRIVFWFDN